MPITEVVAAADARRNLSKYLKTFRKSPRKAKPIVLGPHRKAEAVLLPVEQYQALLDRAEEVTVRREIADVLVRDTGRRGDIAELARKHGFDPTEFGLS